MKIFNFIPSGDVDMSLPKPTKIKGYVPEWYKKAELSFDVVNPSGLITKSSGLRSCVPFLEAMTSGYCLVTPVDIEFSLDKNGKLRADWDSSTPSAPIDVRDNASGRTIPRPDGYSDVHYVWSSQWGWKVPRGYSVLVTHPLNHFELPFITMSAVVDSDTLFTHGNIPFFLKKDFIGTIPAGTPVAQLIPIKRAKWLHIHSPFTAIKTRKQGSMLNSNNNLYRNEMVNKKEYK
jgi:hypothetical protein